MKENYTYKNLEETSNTPQLRFPKFTGEWAEKKLGEIGNVLQGYGFPDKYQGQKKGDLPFYKVSDISATVDNGERIIKNAPNYVDYSFLQVIHARPIPVGATIFAKIGEAIRSNKRVMTSIPCLIDNNTAAIKANELTYDDFLFYLMSKLSLADYSGGIVPSVNKSAIESISISLPPSLAEQQKIAECLSSLDDMISAEGQKTEALREYKRGLMQQLFPANDATTPQLRFPGFTGEWKEKKLGEIANFQNGYSFDSNTFSNEGDYVIRISDIQNGLVSLNNATRSITNVPEEFKVINGDILIAMSGATTGKIGEYKNKEIAYINQRVGNIKPFDLNKKLLLFMLQSASFTSYLNNILTVGAQPNISAQQICSFPILIPSSPSEQQKIADCLSSLDDMISAQAQKTETLREYKRGLMQQLFPQPSK